MPEPEAATAEAAESPAPEPKKSHTALIIVIAAVIAMVAGAGIWLKSRSPAPKEKVKAPPPATKKKEVKSVLHLESFVVNLGGTEEKAYLRVGVDLGLAEEAKGEKSDPILETALVRDTLLTTLAVAKPDDLLTIEGKVKLKADLVRALQQRAPELGVQEVYFNEFLIQR